jgi:hypothetical protein
MSVNYFILLTIVNTFFWLKSINNYVVSNGMSLPCRRHFHSTLFFPNSPPHPLRATPTRTADAGQAAHTYRQWIQESRRGLLPEVRDRTRAVPRARALAHGGGSHPGRLGHGEAQGRCGSSGWGVCLCCCFLVAMQSRGWRIFQCYSQVDLRMLNQ